MRNKQWQKENIYFFKHVLSSLMDVVLFCHSGKKKERDSECNGKARCVSKCVFVCMCARGSLEFVYEVCRSNGGIFFNCRDEILRKFKVHTRCYLMG